MSEYDDLSVAQLQGYFSDFHKDLFGMRPRYQTAEQMNNRGWLIHEIESLHDHLDKMRATPAGKRQLEMEGWSFD